MTLSDAYQRQLDEKISRLNLLLKPFNAPALEIFTSPEKHYRMRAEFRIWHTEGRAAFNMFSQIDKKPYEVTDFPIGSQAINSLMPLVLDGINQDESLRKRLFQIEFLTNLEGAAVVNLLYHKPLDEEWTQKADAFRKSLGISIVGRARKQKVVLGEDYVIETLNVNSQNYRYQQVESSFTQPNAIVCEKMLAWAQNHSRNFSGDLVELYCGNGNFTIPLSKNFRAVVATEVSKTSVESAAFNLKENGIDNVKIARLSAEEFTQAMDKVRPFKRLAHINLDDYHFSTIFVDPPRAGMDKDTCKLSQRFDNIIYVSCNPDTLVENLKDICETHEIVAGALFDQFPFTHHIEAGVILKKRATT